MNRSKFKDLTTLKTMFLQRYNQWGKTKREQLQSWNILSFNPKTTDVDEHIDLINTLGDMVDQKQEAKKEKFIETMPTMIQTHLITCKDWATVKDTAKSLEHIMTCDPPTPAMPTMATGATVPGLYSHIAHSVDKEEGEIPQPFKGAKPKQTRGRGKPKGKPQQNKDKTHQKPKRQMKLILTKILTITTTMPQVRVEAADLIIVKAETDNSEGLYHETEAKDLNIVSVSFRITTIRAAHCNKIIHNMVAHVSHIFRGTKRILIEAEAGAEDLNILEDMVTVGLIFRTMLEHTSIRITHMISNQNNMAPHAVCVEDLIIPPSIVTRVNTTSTTLWKR